MVASLLFDASCSPSRIGEVLGALAIVVHSSAVSNGLTALPDADSFMILLSSSLIVVASSSSSSTSRCCASSSLGVQGIHFLSTLIPDSCNCCFVHCSSLRTISVWRDSMCPSRRAIRSVASECCLCKSLYWSMISRSDPLNSSLLMMAFSIFSFMACIFFRSDWSCLETSSRSACAFSNCSSCSSQSCWTASLWRCSCRRSRSSKTCLSMREIPLVVLSFPTEMSSPLYKPVLFLPFLVADCELCERDKWLRWMPSPRGDDDDDDDGWDNGERLAAPSSAEATACCWFSCIGEDGPFNTDDEDDEDTDDDDSVAVLLSLAALPLLFMGFPSLLSMKLIALTRWNCPSRALILSCCSDVSSSNSLQRRTSKARSLIILSIFRLTFWMDECCALFGVSSSSSSSVVAL